MNLMKIGLNGQKLLLPNPAGPEKYTYNLFNALALIDKENEYVIYFDKKPDKNWFEKLTNSNPNFTYTVVPKLLAWTQISLASELIKNPPDVFFTAVHTIPMVRSGKTKFVTMIHGLEYKYAAGYNNPVYRLKIDRPVKYAAQHSDKIVVPSKASKDAILQQDWKVDGEKIGIVYEGVSDRFRKTGEDEIKRLREKYKIKGYPYLLFVSTIQPRKNVPNMVAAFSKLIKSNDKYKDAKLLIAGKFGWDFQESMDSPKKFGIDDQVIFLGRIPDEDQAGLFSGSSGYVNVSFEEGFGLPLVEAMACETPCLVSNIEAFEEIGSGFPIFADPNSVQGIAEGMRKLLEGEVSKEEIVEAAKYAQSFTWENTAKRTLEILQDTVKNA